MEEDLCQAYNVAFWVRCYLTGAKAWSYEMALRCLRQGIAPEFPLFAFRSRCVTGLLESYRRTPTDCRIASHPLIRLKFVCLSVLSQLQQQNLSQQLLGFANLHALDLESAATPVDLLGACGTLLRHVAETGSVTGELVKILAFFPETTWNPSLPLSLVHRQAADVPPLSESGVSVFEQSSASHVLLHPPLLFLVCEFVICPALDATCKAIQEVRKSVVTYRLVKRASAKFFANPAFRDGILRRCSKVELQLHNSNHVMTLLELKQQFPPTKLNVTVKDTVMSAEFTSRGVWPQVEQLTFRWFRADVPMEKKLSDTFPNVKHLKLSCMALQSFACIEMLQFLEVAEFTVQSVFAPFNCAGLRNLKRLSITDLKSPLSDIGHFPTVTELNLYRVGPVDGAALALVFPCLRSLSWKDRSHFIKSLGACKHLVELHVNSSQLAGGTLRDPAIRKLHIDFSAPPMDDSALTLDQMIDLEELVISRMIRIKNAASLGSATVTTLDLTDAVCSNLSFMLNFPKLRFLRLPKLRSSDCVFINQSAWLRSVSVKEAPPGHLKRICKVPVSLS